MGLIFLILTLEMLEVIERKKGNFSGVWINKKLELDRKMKLMGNEYFMKRKVIPPNIFEEKKDIRRFYEEINRLSNEVFFNLNDDDVYMDHENM